MNPVAMDERVRIDDEMASAVLNATAGSGTAEAAEVSLRFSADNRLKSCICINSVSWV
jgi:hypothetical protein